MRAVAEAMFAGGPQALTKARLEVLTGRVDHMIAAASPFVRGGMRFALFVLWLAPILLGLHIATLPRLALAERTRVLQALERSRFTNLLLMFVGVRAVLTMIFYEDPAELAQMGYSAAHQTRYQRHARQLTVLRLGTSTAVPVPVESGVRLRGDRADDVDNADESGAQTAAREDVA